MKLLLRLFFLLLALAVAGWLWAGHLVRVAVERGGTRALGVETRLESAKLGLFAGTLDLAGLRVANPPGFRREHFLTLERGEVEVALGSLASERIEAPRLLLEGVELDLERRDDASNYGTILESLERFQGEGDEPSAGEEEEARSLVVREVVVRGVSAHVSLSALGASVSETVSVPEIRLTDVGEKTVPELVAELVTALLDVSAGSLEGVVPADLLRDLEARVGGLEDLAAELDVQARERIEGALEEAGKELSEEARKKVDGALDEARKGLGDVLRGEKE